MFTYYLFIYTSSKDNDKILFYLHKYYIILLELSTFYFIHVVRKYIYNILYILVYCALPIFVFGCELSLILKENKYIDVVFAIVNFWTLFLYRQYFYLPSQRRYHTFECSFRQITKKKRRV